VNRTSASTLALNKSASDSPSLLKVSSGRSCLSFPFDIPEAATAVLVDATEGGAVATVEAAAVDNEAAPLAPPFTFTSPDIEADDAFVRNR
jgi:hypothetical protein